MGSGGVGELGWPRWETARFVSRLLIYRHSLEQDQSQGLKREEGR